MIVQIASLLLAQAATAQAATPPPGCAGGGSLTGFDPETGRWHQTWIGSSPGVVRFEGGPVGGKMVLTGWWQGSGPNGEDGLTRMTYSVAEDGAVRQFGEFSADHGLTWQPNFDFIYRRTAPAGD